MNTLQFFLEHHHRLYFLSGGLFDRLNDLTDEQMRICPNSQNSIAWLLWHIARCEDAGINRMVVDGTQVINTSDWINQLVFSRKDIGTGMRFTEVKELSHTINISALLKYVRTVAEKTEKIISDYTSINLDEKLSDHYLSKVLYSEELVPKDDKTVFEIYKNKTKGWFLGHLGLTHAKGHLSQILIIRKLQGLGSGGL